jgi:hypothetical protein
MGVGFQKMNTSTNTIVAKENTQTSVTREITVSAIFLMRGEV